MVQLASLAVQKPQGVHALKSYTLTLEIENKPHRVYNTSVEAKDGRKFSISIMPIYRNGSKSLLDYRGEARIEVCELRPNDFMKYRVVYSNVCESKLDLGRDVLSELNEALIHLNVLNEYDLMNLEFRENNRKCLIAA